MDPVRETCIGFNNHLACFAGTKKIRSAFGALEPFGWPKRSPRHVPDNAVHDKI